MRRTGASNGFTLIEMMFVVVVIGVLAAVAVVTYSKVTRRAKSSEVAAMFAEFKNREEMWASEKGRYLGACAAAMPAAGVPDMGCVEGAYWPTPLNTKAQMNVTAPPVRWQQLRVQPGKGALYCQYNVIAGPGGQNGNMGPVGTSLWTEVAGIPPKNWFYMMAQCDWDNDLSANAVYWQRGDLNVIGNNGNTTR